MRRTGAARRRSMSAGLDGMIVAEGTESTFEGYLRHVAAPTAESLARAMEITLRR